MTPEFDDLLSDLNGPQREAVEHGDGPLLIVAGAGSGKTRVITRRVAHLIRRGADPRSILAITFTNKAAGEMRERVARLVGDGRVLMATFHAFCARVLRVDGSHVGLEPGFTIYDRDDQLALVKDIEKELGVDAQHVAPRAVLAAISRFKNDGLHPEDVEDALGSPFERVAGRVYGRYRDQLRAANAADFDDLLLLVQQLFREQPEVLDRYRDRYRHVLVDEYQDTNLIQDRIARSIAEGSGNLCATGDPDQSIYKWRGARIRNILEFQRDYPTARVVRLEQNYRSTNHILGAASAVIARNPGRLMGPLWSELGDGLKVTVLSCDDEEAEADQVVRRIAALRAEKGLRLSDVAVFYRANALSRPLERALRLHNLAYEIVGAVEFYQRKEVKDLLAYLRVLTNPADSVAFLRIVNVPARGIGKTSLERLRSWAVPLGLSAREAARRAGEAPGLPSRARASLLQFSALLDGLEATLSGPPEETFRLVVERTAYLDHLRDYGGQEATERIENVAELEGALLAYVRNATDPGVAGFLQETALVSDVDAYDAQTDKLVLMTVHAAKGLEFPAVFVVGLEEGMLPHARALESEEDIHEERRLCYVAMTRAERHLTLSWAARRATFGQWAPTVPSRFLDELPADHVELADLRSFTRTGPARGSSSGGGGGWNTSWGPAAGAGGRGAGGGHGRGPEGGPGEGVADYVPDPDDYLDEAEGPRVPRPGTAVRHAHFGQGVVIEVRGTGGKARITVRFERFGDKQLMAEYARLEEVF